MKNLRVNIIGAGIAGLAAAIRLAARGHKVRVFEQSTRVGGKMGQLEWEGFRWDTGPSLFTMPELAEELFRLAGKDMGDHVPYERLDIICRYFYEDGKVLNAYADPARFASEMREVLGESEGNILSHLDHSRKIYELTSDVFIFSVFNRASTFVSKKFLKALMKVRVLKPLLSMHHVNSKALHTAEAVQLFDRYATYNGSDPYRAPATLNVIAHLEHNMGAYFPKQGMRSLADGLYSLAQEMGVEFYLGQRVDELRMEGRRCTGTLSQGQFTAADLVVSDMDIHHFYGDLVPGLAPPSIRKRKEGSTSALIFYWAMDRSYPGMDLHNIFFARNYREEFHSLQMGRGIYCDPTVYVFISSRKVKGDAPPDSENWFVMINVSADSGQDWKELAGKARKDILGKLERMTGENIRKHILHEKILDPPGIEQGTSSLGGSLYGNSSNSSFSAFGRHPNYRRKYKNLYFVGGSVHPGGGIPLCLASARIADHLIQEHHG